MISVFFHCSSPYVGYTLKQADYVNKQMLRVTSRVQMTESGYLCFSRGGSNMLLGNFEGKKYFHTRDVNARGYDEQGRPVTTNIAFLGSAPEDDATVGKIAAYAFVREQEFNERMAEMITLISEGFTVDFDRLTAFLKQMAGNVKFQSEDNKFNEFFDTLLTDRRKIVLFAADTSLKYFHEQTDGNLQGEEPAFVFTTEQMQQFVKKVAVELPPMQKSDITKEEPQGEEGKTNGEQTEKSSSDENGESTQTIHDKKAIDERTDKKHEKMQDIRDKLESIQKELNRVQEQIKEKEDALGTLENDLKQNETRVKELEKEYESIGKKNRVLKILLAVSAVLAAVLLVLVIVL